MCEKSNSKSNGNGESFGELSKQKQALQRERDSLIEESTRLRSEMTNAEDRINGLEKESAEGKIPIDSLNPLANQKPALYTAFNRKIVSNKSVKNYFSPSNEC